MVKHERRPHLSSILSDHHPAIDREACGPVSRLSGQAGTQVDLFIYSPALSQALVESSDSRYVIICGETKVHDHDSYYIYPRGDSIRRLPGSRTSAEFTYRPSTFNLLTMTHSSPQAILTPDPTNSPTVPGNLSHRSLVNKALTTPISFSPDIVPKIVCGCPQGEGNGKKSQARTKFIIPRAGSDQNNVPS